AEGALRSTLDHPLHGLPPVAPGRIARSMSGAGEDWAGALARVEGRAYWRAVGELLEDPAFALAAARELPFLDGDDVADPASRAAALAPGGLSRRDFLRLMGASLALAGAG